MSDDTTATNTTATDDKQPTLPGVAAAEKRAAAAEKRAAELEDRERKRQAAADKAKRDSDIKSVDDAKRVAAEAEERERKAIARAEAAEKRIRDRIDARFQKLPDDVRKTIGEFQDTLSIDQWEKMVDMEYGRMGNANPTDDDTPTGGAPPAAPAGAGRRNHAADGRDLHPKTREILEQLGVDDHVARKVIVAETETEGGVRKARFVYPPLKLKKHIRERSLAPTLLTEENRRKIIDS